MVHFNILDSLESVIEIIPESANENGYYNKDVNVTINVEDINIYSGIQSVKYWVENNGIITQEDVLFTFDNKTPTYNELVNIKEFNITVDSKLNNSDNVILKVQVLDNAGNEKIESINMKIDTTKPTIKLSFDSNDANIIEDRGYFKINRKAYIEITERTSSFDELNATSIISIKAFNYLNKKIELNVEDMISDWVTVKGTTPDEDKHIAEILFSADGNYDLTLLSYTDNAGNKNDDLDICDSITPFTFTIDKIKPTATISINDNTWDKLLDFVTFGIYSKKIINISANANDDVSPVRLEYCKLNDTTIKTTSDLDEIQDWKKYSDFNINQTECFVVYIKATDAAGNYTYISSDGAILDTNLPKITLTPEHTDITHNNIGVYNHDVKIKVDVSKDKPYSGIKTVEYWVIKDGIETQRETIFSFEKTAPIYAELVDTFNYDIIVDSEKNNSCDVNVYVGVTDNAGNYKEENIKIDIDTIAPVIHIDYDNNNYYQIKNDRGYFASTRTAKITIDERDGHFNLDDVVKSIKITANDVNGKQIKDINTTEMISRYTDDSEHIVNISYIKEANYNLVPIVYQDLAENDAIIETGNSVSPYKFTVDINEPTATITVGELGTWNKIVEKLTFGLWSKDYVQVNCTVNDNISPIESISYYKTSDTTLKQVSDLEKLSNDNWIDFKPFDIKCNERFIIYLKVVDYAGNTKYISTNGIILDDIKPVVETVKPEITITPEQPINGIYSSDVKVSVKVVDNPIGIDNVYSGLKEVRYEIYNMGNKTQEGSLYKFDLTDPTQQDLCQIYEQENAIIVDKNLNNSNDVVIKVYAIDNAYNDNEASVGIKIDASAPIVKVDYDNNDGDITFANAKTDAYFNANRKATITISERNFDPKKVLIDITNSDGAVPQLSSWSIVNGTGNGDDTLHIATLSYVNDGDYTFDIKCTDIAENNGVINYNNSIAPNKFTIDKTKPVVSISYDNNNSSNGNYYNASRNATITINEHNFEISRANVKLTAIDNGTNIGLPYVSNWSSNGDTHTAKISYTSDALYTFDFEYKDKAGNSISDIAQQSFYVDKTNPTLSISNIVDHSANNSSGNIGFKIITLDNNLDTFNPILTATIKNGNKFETKQIELGTFSDISNGKVYTVNNIDLDGIYRITCVATDKAGNSYSNVTLYNSDGSSYLQNSSSNDTLLTFSINRNGSTFEIDNNTTDLIKKYYVQKVKNDVVLVETNTDNLVSYEVTLNNKKLKENKDYTVSLSGGNGNWSKYTYNINKSLFEDEGEYTIVLSSVDKATNNAFSDIKDASVKFVVDRSAPVVAITGIGNNSRYRTNQQSVTLIPADDGGSLKSLIVALLDNEGNIIKEIIHLEEVDLQKTLEENDGKINFDIDEGLYQNVKIICTDYSVDDSNATNVYEAVFNNVSVSSNSFMIFWANKSLRYGTIIGITTLIFGLVTYIAIKKRKQQNTKNI